MIKKLSILLIILSCVFVTNKFVLADDGICPFDREMNLGDENSSIKELQKFLALDKDVYTGPATGYFGPLTQKAVKNFQEKTGLLANGKIDLATATVLCQIYLSYKSSEPVNNDDSLTVDSSCFLKTLNLELGYYDEVTEEVLNLQRWLYNNGFYPEKMFTGYFGPLTKKAVIRFQKSQGILQTGIVGVKTTAAICGGKSNSEITNDTDSLDLAITGLDINPKQIDVGTNIQILVKEQNISYVTSGLHTTSLYINEKEVADNNISKLTSGEENLSINYNWKCDQKGIYIFKIFVDSNNDLIESNKYNNVLVFPVNCGGVVQDYKYSCNTETSSCDIDASGSMTLDECKSSCKIGDKSLPDLVVKSFSPTQIKIGETLPLKIVERNDGNSKAERHKYDLSLEFNGESKDQPGLLFGELNAQSEQEATGNWTCKVAGVYTITINLDPDDSIKESNEANNKKVFKIECADESGKVPEEKEKEKEEEKEGDAGGNNDKPDLTVNAVPAQMSSGKNTVNLDIKNNSQKDITNSFYLLIQLLDSNGKMVDSTSGEFKGLKAGQNISGNPFKETVNCDISVPHKYKFTIDSTNVISEGSESNNVAETVCGEVKSDTGNGGGTKSGDKEKLLPCASGSATLEIKSLSSRTPDGLANDRVISYNIGNNNSTKAEGVKISLKNGSNVVKSQGISNISGCSSYNPASYESSIVYTCQGNEQTIDFVVTYDGTKSVSKSVDVKCAYSDKAGQTLYCELDKSVNSSNEVRLSVGENIKYTLKVSGNTSSSLDATKASWSGVDSSSGLSAYKKFNGYSVGRYPVSGVKVNYTHTVDGESKVFPVDCQNVTVVITNSSTNPGKVPNLNTDTKCITNLDLSSSMTGDLCFTNYIMDLNNLCTLKYAWAYKNGTIISGKESKTACVTKSQFKDLPVGETEVLLSTAKCDYNGESYSQPVKCYINAYKSSSGSSSGNLTASCTASPASVKTNSTVSFSASVNKSGFSSGKCSSLNYSWTGCSSTSSSCNTSYTTTGTKPVSVKASCSDDSSKYATANCSVSVTDGSSGGYNPTPSDPIKSGSLSATCKCTSTGCNVTITGSSSDYNAYTCTWTINGTVKSYVTTCKGYNTTNPSSASVKVVEDSTGKSTSAGCSIN